MKNITQSVKIRAGSLVGFQVPEALVAEYDDFLSTPPPKEDESVTLQDRYQDTRKALVEKLKRAERYQELLKLGVELPTDVIEMKMTLGSLAFDLWAGNTPAPSSPMKQHVHNKHAQDLAGRMDKDELVLTESECKTIWAALEDEDIWYQPTGKDDDRKPRNVAFSVHVDSKTGDKKERVFAPINAFGARAFHELISAAIEWVTTECEKAAPAPSPKENK